ncbi:MAG: DUF4468 domain-containing protein [Pseudomonadota bacterium]
MNKIKIVLLCISLLLSACAGVAGKDTRISDEVEVMWYTKGQIYTAAKAWIAEYLPPPKATMGVDDREFGRIIGFVKTPYPCIPGPDCATKSSWLFGYTFEITMENQKFSVALSNLRLSYPAQRMPNGKDQPAVDRPLTREEIDSVARPALSSLSQGLKLEVEKVAAIR